jgi:hypothetical protein
MTRSEEPGRPARRILICGPEGEPLWVRLHVEDVGLTGAGEDTPRLGLTTV